VTTLPYDYSFHQVCQDIKSSCSQFLRLHPMGSFYNSVNTANRICLKVMAGMREQIINFYFSKCLCSSKPPCSFHADGHPFFKNFYDKRPEPSIWWVYKKFLAINIMEMKREAMAHPRKTLLALSAMIYSIMVFPNISSALLITYGLGESICRIRRIFD